MKLTIVACAVASAIMGVLCLFLTAVFFVRPANDKIERVRAESREAQARLLRELESVRKLAPAVERQEGETNSLWEASKEIAGEVDALRTTVAETRAQSDANRKALEETVAWSKERLESLESRVIAGATASAASSTSSSPAPVVAQVLPAPGASASSTGSQVVEAQGIRFELLECAQANKVLTFKFLVTSLERDTDFTVLEGTRFFDDAGREIWIHDKTIGNFSKGKGYRLERRIIKGVPTPVTLSRGEIESSIGKVAVLYFGFKPAGSSKDFTQEFRDIPVAR